MICPLAPDLWELTSDQRVAAGVHMPIRTTIARLPEGLWIHSPLALEDGQAAAIDTLGPVRWIVAPNALHHLHAGPALARWPDAALVASPALKTKRPDLPIRFTLDEDPPWGEEIEAIPVEGAPGIGETVFFHRASRSLVCADLVFHVQQARGWLTPLVLTTTGTWRCFAQSRVWRWQTRDRAAAAASAERILALPVERVVPGHGDVLEERARERLAEALAWMRSGG